MNDKFRNFDTRQPDGVYITFHREEAHDSDANPRDYLFQDPDYRVADQARLESWQSDEWHFIGIRARAEIDIVRNGVGVTHQLTSGGIWGVESDSGADYLNGLAFEEIQNLLSDLDALGTSGLTRIYKCARDFWRA